MEGGRDEAGSSGKASGGSGDVSLREEGLLSKCDADGFAVSSRVWGTVDGAEVRKRV